MELCNIMLITRDADGSVGRIGPARVFQEDFDSARLKMKWIVLRGNTRELECKKGGYWSWSVLTQLCKGDIT